MKKSGSDSYLGVATLVWNLGLVSAFLFLFFSEIEFNQDEALDFLAKCGLMLVYIGADFVVGFVGGCLADEWLDYELRNSNKKMRPN